MSAVRAEHQGIGGMLRLCNSPRQYSHARGARKSQWTHAAVAVLVSDRVTGDTPVSGKVPHQKQRPKIANTFPAVHAYDADQILVHAPAQLHSALNQQVSHRIAVDSGALMCSSDSPELILVLRREQVTLVARRNPQIRHVLCKCMAEDAQLASIAHHLNAVICFAARGRENAA